MIDGESFALFDHELAFCGGRFPVDVPYFIAVPIGADAEKFSAESGDGERPSLLARNDTAVFPEVERFQLFGARHYQNVSRQVKDAAFAEDPGGIASVKSDAVERVMSAMGNGDRAGQEDCFLCARCGNGCAEPPVREEPAFFGNDQPLARERCCVGDAEREIRMRSADRIRHILPFNADSEQ